MFYHDDLITGKVPKQVKERTQENMEVYNMSLLDAFEEASRRFAKHDSNLWRAWYSMDFRKYIPSVYKLEYLDFEKYPLEYTECKK